MDQTSIKKKNTRVICTARSIGSRDFDAHYSSDNLVVSDEYQEEEHPRDMHGKWTSGDQTESPAFKSWFGESKIVDEHGKPLVVYHGTRHKFSRFDIDKGQVGVHFSVSPEVATAPRSNVWCRTFYLL